MVNGAVNLHDGRKLIKMFRDCEVVEEVLGTARVEILSKDGAKAHYRVTEPDGRTHNEITAYADSFFHGAVPGSKYVWAHLKGTCDAWFDFYPLERVEKA